MKHKVGLGLRWAEKLFTFLVERFNLPDETGIHY